MTTYLYDNKLSLNQNETNINSKMILNATTNSLSNENDLIKQTQLSEDIPTQVNNSNINDVQKKDAQTIIINNNNNTNYNDDDNDDDNNNNISIITTNSNVIINSTPNVTVTTDKNKKFRSLSLDSQKRNIINTPGLQVITSLSSPYASSTEFESPNLINSQIYNNLSMDAPIVINNINVNNVNNNNQSSILSATSLTQNPLATYSVSTLNKNIPLKTNATTNNSFTYGINHSNSLPNNNSHRTSIIHSSSPTNNFLLSCLNSNPSSSPNPSPSSTPLTITPPSAANHTPSPRSLYTVLPNSTNTSNLYNPLTATALPTSVLNQNRLRNISIPSNDNKNSTTSTNITINTNNITFNATPHNGNIHSSVSSNLYITDPNNQSITNIYGQTTANDADLIKNQSPDASFQNTNPWLLEFQPMTSHLGRQYPNYHINSIEHSTMEPFNSSQTTTNTSPTLTKGNINHPSYYYI